jgi:hypothetical protein
LSQLADFFSLEGFVELRLTNEQNLQKLFSFSLKVIEKANGLKRLNGESMGLIYDHHGPSSLLSGCEQVSIQMIDINLVSWWLSGCLWAELDS